MSALLITVWVSLALGAAVSYGHREHPQLAVASWALLSLTAILSGELYPHHRASALAVLTVGFGWLVHLTELGNRHVARHAV